MTCKKSAKQLPPLPRAWGVELGAWSVPPLQATRCRLHGPMLTLKTLAKRLRASF